jgi:hypothetical protein
MRILIAIFSTLAFGQPADDSVSGPQLTTSAITTFPCRRINPDPRSGSGNQITESTEIAWLNKQADLFMTIIETTPDLKDDEREPACRAFAEFVARATRELQPPQLFRLGVLIEKARTTRESQESGDSDGLYELILVRLNAEIWEQVGRDIDIFESPLILPDPVRQSALKRLLKSFTRTNPYSPGTSFKAKTPDMVTHVPTELLVGLADIFEQVEREANELSEEVGYDVKPAYAPLYLHYVIHFGLDEEFDIELMAATLLGNERVKQAARSLSLLFSTDKIVQVTSFYDSWGILPAFLGHLFIYYSPMEIAEVIEKLDSLFASIEEGGAFSLMSNLLGALELCVPRAELLSHRNLRLPLYLRELSDAVTSVDRRPEILNSVSPLDSLVLEIRTRLIDHPKIAEGILNGVSDIWPSLSGGDRIRLSSFWRGLRNKMLASHYNVFQSMMVLAYELFAYFGIEIIPHIDGLENADIIREIIINWAQLGEVTPANRRVLMYEYLIENNAERLEVVLNDFRGNIILQRRNLNGVMLMGQSQSFIESDYPIPPIILEYITVILPRLYQSRIGHLHAKWEVDFDGFELMDRRLFIKRGLDLPARFLSHIARNHDQIQSMEELDSAFKKIIDLWIEIVEALYATDLDDQPFMEIAGLVIPHSLLNHDESQIYQLAAHIVENLTFLPQVIRGNSPSSTMPSAQSILATLKSLPWFSPTSMPWVTYELHY